MEENFKMQIQYIYVVVKVSVTLTTEKAKTSILVPFTICDWCSQQSALMHEQLDIEWRNMDNECE